MFQGFSRNFQAKFAYNKNKKFKLKVKAYEWPIFLDT